MRTVILWGVSFCEADTRTYIIGYYRSIWLNVGKTTAFFDDVIVLYVFASQALRRSYFWSNMSRKCFFQKMVRNGVLSNYLKHLFWPWQGLVRSWQPGRDSEVVIDKDVFINDRTKTFHRKNPYFNILHLISIIMGGSMPKFQGT